MKNLFKTLFLLTFVSISLSLKADTQFVKYKKYLIPINTSIYEECDKPNIIVTSDVNSLSSPQTDPDDMQSLVHLFASSYKFNTLGLISTPNQGSFVSNSKQHIQSILNAYTDDFNRSNLSSEYQDPSTFIVAQGLTNNTSMSGLTYNANSSTHKGAKLILEEALKVFDGVNCGPIYVLVWGGIPDLALALKESDRRLQAGQIDRGIEEVIRVHFIASVNKTGSLPAYQYIHDNFLVNNRLWLVQSENTFRGINGVGGRPTYDEKKIFLNSLTNEQVTVAGQFPNTSLLGVKSFNQSCLSYVLAKSTAELHSEPLQRTQFVKVGDTPSLLYVMNGDLNDPTTPSWGGRFKLKDPSQSDKWYIDLSINGADGRIYNSTLPPSGSDGLTVGNHVEDIFGDWEQSMDNFSHTHGSACRNLVAPTL